MAFDLSFLYTYVDKLYDMIYVNGIVNGLSYIKNHPTIFLSFVGSIFILLLSL
jgi:hypothetical protein